MAVDGIAIGDRMRISCELIRVMQKDEHGSELVELVDVRQEDDGCKVLVVRTAGDEVAAEARYQAWRAHMEYTDLIARLAVWREREASDVPL